MYKASHYKGSHRLLSHSKNSLSENSNFISNVFAENQLVLSDPLKIFQINWLSEGGNWIPEKKYIRGIFFAFEEVQREWEGKWSHFSIGTGPFDVERSVKRNKGSNWLALIDKTNGNPDQPSKTTVLMTSNGKFLQSNTTPEPFQVVQSYPANDLGKFFDTCIDYLKNEFKYLICRNLNDASRAVGSIRYSVCVEIDIDLPCRKGLSDKIVRQIRGLTP